MKKVKIIKGVYGHRVKNVIVPKSTKDEPFEVTDEIAERLVKKGVAELVGTKTSIVTPQTTTSQDEQPNQPNGGTSNDGNSGDDNSNGGAPDENQPNGGTSNDGNSEDDKPEEIKYSERMKLDELKEVAIKMGIDAETLENLTKKQVIELLDNAKNAPTPGVSDVY